MIRERAQFERDFEARFGPIGQDPRCYWDGILGARVHLRPSDIADLTPRQLMNAVEVADALNGSV